VDKGNPLPAEELVGALTLMGDTSFTLLLVGVSALPSPAPNDGKLEESVTDEKSNLDTTLRSLWPGEG
jgi:hypothetical protein